MFRSSCFTCATYFLCREFPEHLCNKSKLHKFFSSIQMRNPKNEQKSRRRWFKWRIKNSQEIQMHLILIMWLGLWKLSVLFIYKLHKNLILINSCQCFACCLGISFCVQPQSSLFVAFSGLKCIFCIENGCLLNATSDMERVNGREREWGERDGLYFRCGSFAIAILGASKM